MSRAVLLTGASGALGPHVLAELLRSDEIGRVFVLMRPTSVPPGARLEELRRALARVTANSPAGPPMHRDRLYPILGDICQPLLGLGRRSARDLASAVSVIVHAAAETSFHACWRDSYRVNVQGTRNVLEMGRRSPRLEQFLFVSTTCVAGTRTGEIPEDVETVPPDFVNPYERSKWEAERAAALSGLPVRIARLSTCLGAARDGYVHRLGAVHRVLHWFIRGLIPMVPGHPDARVDLIATDVASRWIALAAVTGNVRCDAYHVAAGRNAPTLHELLDCVTDHLRVGHPRARRVERPPVADATTFAMFRRSVEQTGDRAFTRVLRSTDAFLPGLLRPKVYDTARAESVWGAPLPLSDWRETVRRVIDFGLANRWHRSRYTEVHHASCNT